MARLLGDLAHQDLGVRPLLRLLPSLPFNPARVKQLVRHLQRLLPSPIGAGIGGVGTKVCEVDVQHSF